MDRLLAVVLLLLAMQVPSAAEYAGPLIDAHAHLSNATVIDAYVAAMRRHNIAKVLLLGVGGVQKDDAAWIAAAAKKYPQHVLVGVPLPDPLAATAAPQLEADLGKQRGRAVGEVHVRQVSRKIERNPATPAFVDVLRVVARHGLPIIVHQELDGPASASLAQALAAVPQAVVIIAHGGSASPAVLETLLSQHANLRMDLSGMHFLRTPALATETGPLDPHWQALITRMPERFLIGLDVWAANLFDPPMLDRLMHWTRRILGALPPDVAERVAYKNAVVLFRLD